MTLIQNELTLLQAKFNQLDTEIDARLKDFQEGIKNEVPSNYFGQTPTVVTNLISNKGKGILGKSPLGFSLMEQLVVSPIPDLRHTVKLCKQILVR
ncbi:hypothetical protein J1N35_028352 [Gossypium stocksii]|uniref:Uncharacterized protein n=1 Tax=Gossypium stocksii TaxID=47602 RepID=A0A9D3UW71_9ROSI|nr:hypothetical protein J1N35_028352 [Gossypium stocksii]